MKKLLDPKQELFLSYYTNPKSSTFGNALQSGLKAEYSQEYSENITSLMPEWLSENIGDLKRLQKAEKVLDETLDMPAVNDEGLVDNQLLKTKTDVAKFYAKGIGKSKYSERTEHTDSNGEALQPILVQIINDKPKDNTNTEGTE